MDEFVLIEDQQNYDIIKHANEDCVHKYTLIPKNIQFAINLMEKGTLSYAKIW